MRISDWSSDVCSSDLGMTVSPGPPRQLRAAIVGAGMAGILATIKLRKRGIECTVFEKANRVGGTWRDNSYPGLACDVPAHWYTYSFARNPAWDRLLAEGKELLDRKSTRLNSSH